MRVGIICAGEREVAPFLPIICKCKTTEKAMLKFYEGTISDVEVVVLFSGVCKVNAAIAIQILIDTYHVNIIINIEKLSFFYQKRRNALTYYNSIVFR